MIHPAKFVQLGKFINIYDTCNAEWATADTQLSPFSQEM